MNSGVAMQITDADLDYLLEDVDNILYNNFGNICRGLMHDVAYEDLICTGGMISHMFSEDYDTMRLFIQDLLEGSNRHE